MFHYIANKFKQWLLKKKKKWNNKFQFYRKKFRWREIISSIKLYCYRSDAIENREDERKKNSFWSVNIDPYSNLILNRTLDSVAPYETRNKEKKENLCVVRFIHVFAIHDCRKRLFYFIFIRVFLIVVSPCCVSHYNIVTYLFITVFISDLTHMIFFSLKLCVALSFFFIEHWHEWQNCLALNTFFLKNFFSDWTISSIKWVFFSFGAYTKSTFVYRKNKCHFIMSLFVFDIHGDKLW